MNHSMKRQELVNSSEQAYFESDTINLFEIVSLLWSERKKVMSVIGMFVLIGVGVAYLASKTWKSEAIIRPVSESALDKINKTVLDGHFSPIAAFDLFHEAVLSIDIQKKAFNNSQKARGVYSSNDDVASDKKRFERFQKNLEIKKTAFKTERVDSGRLRIVFRSKDANEVDFVINQQMIPLATNYVLRRLQEKHKSIKALKINKVKNKIEEMREAYLYSAQHKLSKLQQGYQLAKNQKIQENNLQGDLISLTSDDDFYHLLGTKYLSERIEIESDKIDVYKKAKNEINRSVMTPEVSLEIFKLRELESVDIEFSTVKIVDIEMPAVKPINSESPNKLLIMLVSLVLGMFVAFIMVFLKISYRRYQYLNKVSNVNK